MASAIAMVCERPVTSCRGFARKQETHTRRAVGKRRRDRFQADLRHLIDRQRQHVGWQAVAVTGKRVDQCSAMLAVME